MLFLGPTVDLPCRPFRAVASVSVVFSTCILGVLRSSVLSLNKSVQLHALIGASALLGFVHPVLAQKQPPSNSSSAFSAQFEQAVKSSCLAQPGELSKAAARKFCPCFASSYVKRFSGAELNALSALAAKSKEARQAINIAMSPERRVCLAESH